MGAAQSEGSYSGHLYIETLQSFFHTGGIIQGTVHLYLTQPVHAQELVLQFKTKEKWTINPDPNGTYEEFKRIVIRPQCHAEKTTISQRFPLYRFSEETTGPGQFSFPFTLKLPSSVPGSFSIEDHVCIGGITNRLTASVTSTGETVQKFHLPLMIMQPFSRPLSSANTIAVTKGCCSSTGRVEIFITVDRDFYTPGGEVGISLGVNNSAGIVPIGAVVVGLYRTVKVSMENGPAFARGSTEKEMIMRKVIPVGQALMAESTVHLQLPVNVNPATVNTQGQMIKCSYSIDVQLQLINNWLHGSSNPTLSHRVVIRPIEPVLLAPPTIPVAWDPNVLPVTQLSMGNSYDGAAFS